MFEIYSIFIKSFRPNITWYDYGTITSNFDRYKESDDLMADIIDENKNFLFNPCVIMNGPI